MGLVRLIFIFVGVTIALLFWQRINKKQGRQHIDPMQEDPRLGRLIPCAACGTYVDQKTAYSNPQHSRKKFFCDAVCAKVGFAKQSSNA